MSAENKNSDKSTLARYLLSKGRGVEKMMPPPAATQPGLKPRNTNVSAKSPPSAATTYQHKNTPAIVKRNQVLKNGGQWFSSPTDVLSPCSQKLWRQRPANHETVPIQVAKLNLMQADDTDEQASPAPGETMDTSN